MSYQSHRGNQMSVLSSLKLVAAKRPQAMPTIQVRRNKLGKQLFEQIKLATALSEGKTYAPLQLRNVRNKESGEVKAIEIARRIRQWWFISETGKVCIQVKYGSRTLEVAKGKNSVEVSSGAELVKALETLKLATESGEFDTQLENAGLKHRNNFKK
jgi:hypothetical protein